MHYFIGHIYPYILTFFLKIDFSENFKCPKKFIFLKN